MSILDTKEISLQLVVPLSASNRSFRLIELRNGIKCFLVSDPNDTSYACSVSVNSGSNNDPPEFPGIAHLVEHMLFSGTKDYPGPSTFYKNIISVGGNTNAFTTYSQTNFQFEVPISCSSKENAKRTSFDDILANFASFFKNPVFNSDCLNREIGLINEEHLANIASDDKIFYHCTKLLSNKQSAFHQFSTGCTETLLPSSRKQRHKLDMYLRNYFEDYYTCANIKVVLRGPQSLNYLQKYVAVNFSGIENHKILSNNDVPIFAPSDMGRLMWVKSSTSRAFRLIFPIKTINRESVFFIRVWIELLGNEAAGSICETCSKLGFTNSIVVFEQRVDMSNSVVVFEANLATRGLANISKLVVLVFSYIEMIKKASHEQISQFMSDFAKREAINSIYQESVLDSTTEVVQYAESLQDKTLEFSYILIGYSYHDPSSFQIDYFRDLTSRYFNLNNFNTILICNVLSPGEFTVGDSECKHDKFYDFDYKELIIDKLRLYANITGDMQLQFPSHNTLLEKFEIPDLTSGRLCPKYHVKVSSEESRTPRLLKTDPHIESWFQRNITSDHRIYVFFQIHIPAEMNPTVYISIDLICDLLGEHLLRKFYECETIGYQWGIWPAINNSPSICFIMCGLAINFDYVVQLLLDQTIEFLQNLHKVPYALYTRSRVRLRKYYQDLLQDEPFKKFMACVYWIIEENTYSIEERFNALEEITVDNLQALGNQFIHNLSKMNILVSGDITADEAEQLNNMITSRLLKNAQNSPSSYETFTSYRIPPGRYVFEADKDNKISSCLIYFDLGDREDIFSRVVLRVLDFMIQATAVSELRIKRKLGYNVLNGQRVMRQSLGYFIYVSSDKFGCRELLEEVDTYLLGISKKLQSMKNKGFKRSVIDPLLSSIEYDSRSANLTFDAEPIQASTNFDTESRSYRNHKGLWEKILSKTYRFSAKDGQEEVDLISLESLSKKDFEAFFNEKVSPHSNRRSLLAIISGFHTDNYGLDENQTLYLPPSVRRRDYSANGRRFSLDFNIFKNNNSKRFSRNKSLKETNLPSFEVISDVKAFQRKCADKSLEH